MPSRKLSRAFWEYLVRDEHRLGTRICTVDGSLAVGMFEEALTFNKFLIDRFRGLKQLLTNLDRFEQLRLILKCSFEILNFIILEGKFWPFKGFGFSNY